MKINLICPINKLSYGYVSVNILKALLKASHEVSLFNINELLEKDIENDDKQFIELALLNKKNFDRNSPTLIIWHHFDLKKHKIFDGKCYGFPIFEVNSFNEQEIEQMNSMDGIFVPSKWAKSIVDNYCKIPTNVAQLGVDFNLFKRDLVQEHKLRNSRVTKFLHIGKWEIRKSQFEIVECFNKAFRKQNSVQLTLVCNNPFISEENLKWEKFVKSTKLSNKISILPRVDSNKEIVEIMKSHHFGLFPSKAEGWNMELHEMIALGKPCIATNYSAHTEYCNNDNCFLIEPKVLETAYDGVFFFGNSKWAKLENRFKESMIKLMKDLHIKRQNKFIFPDYDKSISNFTWESCVDKIINVIKN